MQEPSRAEDWGAPSARAAVPATSHAGAHAHKLLGIGCVIGAVSAFTAQDMAIKWLSGDYALHQIILTRAVIGVVLTLAILVPLEGGYRNLRTPRWPLHVLRGLAIVVANLAFFTGLASLPLGEATAIFFVAPLFITALSVVLLGEQVGMRRWLAVIVGLTGVIVIVRPGGDAFQWAALLPIGAALGYATLQIITRTLGMAEKASTMAFYSQVTFIAVSGGIGLSVGNGRFAGGHGPALEFLLRAWVVPARDDVWIMLGIGVLNAAAAYLISQAYRVAEAGLIAPFEYIALPLAVFWGVIIFADWPDAVAWFGIALIGSAGLYVFYRETIRGRAVAVPRPMPRNR